MKRKRKLLMCYLQKLHLLVNVKHVSQIVMMNTSLRIRYTFIPDFDFKTIFVELTLRTKLLI